MEKEFKEAILEDIEKLTEEGMKLRDGSSEQERLREVVYHLHKLLEGQI